MLRFEYSVVQLNQLPWRQFVNQPNPVASALMAKMRMSPEERPLVKLECLRLLTKLELDPARSRLIGGFIDSYLRLAAEEMRQYERAIAEWDPAEREETMELISSWEQDGIIKGKEQLVEVLLEYRFSTLPTNLTERLDDLTSDQLDDLGKAIFSFMSLADLEAWLDHQKK